MPDDLPPAEGTLWRSVHDALRRELAGGHPPVGASLPSEAMLARRFGVSRITIRQAMAQLAAEGLILKAKARRAVVTAREPRPEGGFVVESLDDIATIVGDARLEVRRWGLARSAAEARLFGLPAATPLPCLRGVLSRAGQPYARSTIFFPPDIGARLRREAFDDPVVFRVLQREVPLRLAWVEITVSALRATAADAAVLPCAVGEPLLLTQLRYHDESGRLVEVAYSRGLAEATRFATRLTAAPRRRGA